MAATVGDGVDIGPSTIPEAGNGVFAARDFEKGEPVTAYEGEIINHAEAQARRSQGHGSHLRTLVSQRWAIDGLRLTPDMRNVGAASMINHGEKPNCNVLFDWVDTAEFEADLKKWMATSFAPYPNPRGRLIVARATRNIRAGEELFVYYGRDYWRT
jgi:SET domain-containing protein